MSQARATLILTRPAPSSDAFLNVLRPGLPSFVDVVISPMVKIVPTGQNVDLTGIEGVIFTSQHGVAHAGAAQDLPAYCVGNATTEAAQVAGWKATCSGPSADALVENLIQTPPSNPLMHISGTHRRGDIAERLGSAGIMTLTATVYDQALLNLTTPALRALNDKNPVILPLFSPRTAEHFAREHTGSAPIHICALSAAVADAARTLNAASCQVVDAPDAHSMTKALENLFHRLETDASAH